MNIEVIERDDSGLAQEVQQSSRSLSAVKLQQLLDLVKGQK